MSRGDDDAADSALGQALELAKAQGARILELRAATSMARARRARGELEGAKTCLAPALGQIEQGLTTRDVLAARALLDSL